MAEQDFVDIFEAFNGGRCKVTVTNSSVPWDDMGRIELTPSIYTHHAWWKYCGPTTCSAFDNPRFTPSAKSVRHWCDSFGFIAIGCKITTEPCEPYARQPWDTSVASEANGAVYFLQCRPGEPIKIGMSGNVLRRMDALQTMNPVRLNCLGIIKRGGNKLEKELHEQFSDARLHGEWFSAVPELLNFIETSTEKLS